MPTANGFHKFFCRVVIVLYYSLKSLLCENSFDFMNKTARKTALVHPEKAVLRKLYQKLFRKFPIVIGVVIRGGGEGRGGNQNI